MPKPPNTIRIINNQPRICQKLNSFFNTKVEIRPLTYLSRQVRVQSPVSSQNIKYADISSNMLGFLQIRTYLCLPVYTNKVTATTENPFCFYQIVRCLMVLIQLQRKLVFYYLQSTKLVTVFTITSGLSDNPFTNSRCSAKTGMIRRRPISLNLSWFMAVQRKFM